MPCGAEGSSAISNSGGPVNCVSTPGGFAWEPPGG
jgi:serine/threonine-protein kinase